jgi:hypothetical protein
MAYVPALLCTSMFKERCGANGCSIEVLFGVVFLGYFVANFWNNNYSPTGTIFTNQELSFFLIN